jgi:large subunit ribosomal protein L17
MLRNLITSLFEQERVKTTQAKAKEARKLAEAIITLAKRGDLHARRQALSVIRTKKAHAKLFGELKERFQDRPGGYTRIIPLGMRKGDGAPVSILELVGRPEKLPKGKKKKAAAG